MTEVIDQTQKFLDNINFSSINELNLRLHPQDRLRRELQYASIIKINNTYINNILDPNIHIDNYDTIINEYENLKNTNLQLKNMSGGKF